MMPPVLTRRLLHLVCRLLLGQLSRMTRRSMRTRSSSKGGKRWLQVVIQVAGLPCRPSLAALPTTHPTPMHPFRKAVQKHLHRRVSPRPRCRLVRERPGVYCKPEGAAAERAGASTILSSRRRLVFPRVSPSGSVTGSLRLATPWLTPPSLCRETPLSHSRPPGTLGLATPW